MEASGNIIKNVKSVVVPNTGGMKGITAAVAAGVVVGDPDKQLEVLADVKTEDIPKIAEFISNCEMTVMKASSGKMLDIDLSLYAGEDSVRLRICDYHTNIVLIEKNGEVLHEADADGLHVPWLGGQQDGNKRAVSAGRKLHGKCCGNALCSLENQ